jgi:hypothetical protein
VLSHLSRCGSSIKAWLTLAVWLSLSATACAQGIPLEQAVKATYLYKFAPFVVWPEATFGGPSSPFVICLVGADPFGPFLDRTVAGQRVEERSIQVRRLAKADPNTPCHIMYVGGTPEQVKQALQAAHGAPTLTVTDGAATPGILDFAMDHGRVRFRVDDESAAENGLVISSKLLSLALSVKPRQAAGKSP